MKFKTLIPKGVATLLPEGVLAQRAVERKIFSVLFRAGYQEVIPPLFEYIEIFEQTVGSTLLERSYKVVDRATGRLMALRPDVTPQIARMAATLLADRVKPLRLCYAATLFRHEEEHAGQEREIFQIGGEQIGPSSPEGDAEMIALSIKILQQLKIKSFKIVLGQMAFIRGILTPFEKEPVLFKHLLDGIERKDQARLTLILKEANVTGPLRKRILALPDLFGGAEVFERAASIARGAGAFCQAGLKRLSAVYQLLTQKGMQKYLLIDLGETRGFDYYTGTIFEIFAGAVGVALGGGGRYDHLMEKFGAPECAIGFALNVGRVVEVTDPLSRSKPPQKATF